MAKIVVHQTGIGAWSPKHYDTCRLEDWMEPLAGKYGAGIFTTPVFVISPWRGSLFTPIGIGDMLRARSGDQSLEVLVYVLGDWTSRPWPQSATDGLIAIQELCRQTGVNAEVVPCWSACCHGSSVQSIGGVHIAPALAS